MADLFTYGEFASYLQVPQVDNSSTDVARRIASGWLKSVTGLADWPVPVPDNLFGWGLELAAIAFRNPSGAASESIDDYNVSHDRGRRADILKAAAAAYSGAGTPSFSFPAWDWHWAVVPVVDPLTD
jgi:hypothetical protein